MKFDPDIVLWALTALPFAFVFCLAYQAFSPFGFNSNCRHVRTMRFRGGRKTELFVSDDNMMPSMVKSFLKQHNREIFNLDDLKRISIGKRNRNKLPRASRIIGEQDGVIWALDTSDWFSGRKCRVLRLTPIEAPTSFEHCYIAVKPCT